MIIGFGISPSRVKASAGVSYDADASAFFTAASITDSTQKSAVNQLVLDLKSYNIWTKMKALYPIIGGSASSHAVNLKTPGTYNLTFATGMTHSSTGMVSNGTSGYGNTGFNSTLLTSTSMHLSVYSRTQTVGTSIEIGNNISNTYVHVRAAANFVAGNATLSLLTFTTTTDARGFWIGTKRGTTDRENYRNGTTQNSTAANDSTAFNNINLFICATNNNGTSQLYSTKEIAFSSIGDGLTDTESANFYTAVQAYQTTLSRQV